MIFNRLCLFIPNIHIGSLFNRLIFCNRLFVLYS